MERKYFAKLNDNNEVVKVVVGDSSFLNTFVDETPGRWVECDKNTNYGIHWNRETNTPSEDQSKAFRKNFPALGDTYDDERDAFIRKKPYASWVLNETTCDYDPPIPRPEASLKVKYYWDEEAHQEDNTQGWKSYTE